MKKCFLFLLLLFGVSSVLNAQNKYAVLITGDYAAQGVSEQDRWNRGGDNRRPAEEFWNDTYLMWEMLQSKGFDKDNIFVLFANGVDYVSDNPLYQPPYGDTVTNDSATIRKVTDLFIDLRNGSNGKPQITENDFLFIWVFDHGHYSLDYHSSFCLLDGLMCDTTFSSLLHPIPANRKAYWMQQCNGGGFADDLGADNSVFHSACQAEESAYPADDYTIDSVVFTENDSLQSHQYKHGEFDYHLISVCNGCTPTGQLYYANEPLANGDLNHDGFVSFYEAYLWEKNHESIEKYSQQLLLLGETPLYSDTGNIGSHASFEYPTLLFDTVTTNELHRGIIGISKDLFVADNQTLTITGNSTVTLCNNARLVIEKGGSLVINGNVRFFGVNDNLIEIYGDFSNNSDSLAFNNLKVYVESENFSITKASFYDTELDFYQAPTHWNPGIQESGSITVMNCLFSNPHKQFAVRLKNAANFCIQNNTINASAGNGVYVANSGNSIGENTVRRISYNTINQCSSAGLVLYASSGNVLMNQIFGNGTGVNLLNNCNITFFNGNCEALFTDNTQFIHDNNSYEVYLTSNCAPQNMHYNAIVDTIDCDRPFVYYDGNIAFDEPTEINPTIIDVTKNMWGNNFNPFVHLYSTTPVVTYDTLPYWPLGTCFNNSHTEGRSLVASADSLCELGEYELAKIVYRQVVDSFPHTTSAATALKTMLPLEIVTGQDYSSLRRYYLTDTAIMSDTILGKLASSLSNKCDERMGNYTEAIAWYEDVITNPNTIFCDSIFATIDLGELYLEMESVGKKAIGKLAQFKPKSKAVFEAQCLYALSLLPRELGDKVSPFARIDDPLPLWTDTVTSQPEGYLVDENGNVEISSAEGLAWLISVVNGLNGCIPDDFDGRSVKLSNDIDFGEIGLQRNFSPIGNRETPFRGTFDGNCHKIQHIRQCYSKFGPDNHHYFDIGVFGYIHHAVVKNVSLDPTCVLFSSAIDDGYFRGEMVGFADSLSLMENCHFNNTGIHSNGGGLVGLNRNSTVRNCSCGGRNNSLGSPEEGGGLVATNRSEGGYADAVVENCYFQGSIDPSYSTWYVGGLVCYNETAVNNNGYRAIIRNCHSTPTSDFYSFKDGGNFAAINSDGSLINNCYTDFTKVSYPLMVGLNYGEMDNCYTYTIIDEIGTLADPVTINDSTTQVLLDALNLWIIEQEHPELYKTWTTGTDNIPVFGDYYVGIQEDVTPFKEVAIYPNPTTGRFTVEGANVAKVEVYNPTGQLVKTIRNTNEIILKGLPQGMYLLRVTDDKGAVATRRIVVE